MADDDTPPTLGELRQNLAEYQEQLQQVEALLLDDTDNEEYRGIYASLTEAAALTRELLAEAEGPPAAAAEPPPPPQQQQQQGQAPPPEQPPGQQPQQPQQQQQRPAPEIVAAAPPELRLPPALPPAVAAAIRAAQQRAALAGTGPPAWAVGARVRAPYPGDGERYDATVVAATAGGGFVVSYDGYEGEREEVAREALALREAAPGGGAGGEYKGVAEPRRRKVGAAAAGGAAPGPAGAAAAAAAPEEMPAWLEIKPGDDDKTVAKKRKLQKAHKSRARFQAMDAATEAKASSWKSFVAGKGSKKAAGFLSAAAPGKRRSIFATSDAGRVGVAGGGAPPTEAAKRRRHEFAGAQGGGGGGGEWE